MSTKAAYAAWDQMLRQQDDVGLAALFQLLRTFDTAWATLTDS